MSAESEKANENENEINDNASTILEWSGIYINWSSIINGNKMSVIYEVSHANVEVIEQTNNCIIWDRGSTVNLFSNPNIIRNIKTW